MRLPSLLVVVAAGVAWLPAVPSAQHGDLTHNQAAVPDAAVDFGVLPFPATTPLGPEPCLQTGAIGGPADPCAYMLHHLTPEEVTVVKGGQVGFVIHGGGHALAIYEVSRNTTREKIGQFLCFGPDPSATVDPDALACNLSTLNANAQHIVGDGRGNVVIVADAVVSATPTSLAETRVWFEPGRLMSAGGNQFLNGGTTPAGPDSNGQIISYRFLKNGRYLVICMNRTHFLNDWMFGFVNVVAPE